MVEVVQVSNSMNIVNAVVYRYYQMMLDRKMIIIIFIH